MSGDKTRRFFKAGRLEEIPASGLRSFVVGKKRILIARYQDAVYAIEDRCTHDDGPLSEGEYFECQVECPRHGARFDVRNGQALCLPAVGNVEVYNVEVRDGEIYVSLPTHAEA